MKPRVRDVSSENNVTVPPADQVTRGIKRPIEVIEAHLVELMVFVRSYHIITEGHERHMDGFDPAEQIRINCPRQNEAVNQPMFLKNRRQVNPLGRCSRGIMQRREEHVLFQAVGARFDALQNPSMKRMEEIAVAQEKADHFRASFENPAGLRIGAKSQLADRTKYPRAGFPAYLGAGI